MSVAKGEKISPLNKAKRLYRGVAGELKKVHWPNRKELVSYTTIVLVATSIVGLGIWIIDSGIGFIMSLLIK